MAELFNPVQRHHGVRALDRDKLALVKRSTCADLAHTAFFQLQDQEPEEALMGVATLFALLCERTGTDPYVLHQMGHRVLRDEDFHKKTNDSLQSLKDCVGLRFMGQEVTIL